LIDRTRYIVPDFREYPSTAAELHSPITTLISADAEDAR
jgi:hypothetical protein